MYSQVFIIMKTLLMSGQELKKVVVFRQAFGRCVHVSSGLTFFSLVVESGALYCTEQVNPLVCTPVLLDDGVVSSSWPHATVPFLWLKNVAFPHMNCSRIICRESYPQHLVIFRFWFRFIVLLTTPRSLKCGCFISATVKVLLLLDSAITYFRCDGAIAYETFFLFSIKAKSLLQGRKLCPEHRNF
jgi:hypothetical protein